MHMYSTSKMFSVLQRMYRQNLYFQLQNSNNLSYIVPSYSVVETSIERQPAEAVAPVQPGLALLTP